MKCVLPLTKSPAPDTGRFGPLRFQDWFRALRFAAAIAQEFNNARIFVVSEFAPNNESEADIYYQALTDRLLVQPKQVLVHRQETETIGQIEYVLRLMTENDQVIIISSPLHWPRVWWLTHQNPKVERMVVWGIPRPKEAFTDIVLAFMFPILDVLGLRAWFLGKTHKRRVRGVL